MEGSTRGVRAKGVKNLIKKRRQEGESVKTAARRIAQDTENPTIASLVQRWLSNKKPVRPKKAPVTTAAPDSEKPTNNKPKKK
jgi:hypothetical protein